MHSPRQGFDFTQAMRLLCADIASRHANLSHIDVGRVALNVCQARRDVPYGMFASLTPLRFASGVKVKKASGIDWSIERLSDKHGHEYLYLLSFYLPRFQNLPFEEKLTTVFHELWHISPEFNGDLRRHKGRCYAHGRSQREYDARMTRLAQEWLALDPPSHLYEFLSLSFGELVAEYGRVEGHRWRAPRLIRQ